jgi:tetratricopeptide (TPR) repeat protein
MIACAKTPRLSFAVLCILVLLALTAGCTALRRPPVETIPEKPVPTLPPPPPPVPKPVEPVAPRHEASLQLTDQGRLLLLQKRFDDAIRTLEQAISLYPRNGESYYYMAEAWLAKGSYRQAAEFNRLAGMYLDTTHWAARLDRQQRAIAAGHVNP